MLSLGIDCRLLFFHNYLNKGEKMLIKLNKKSTGEVIISAFVKASTFVVNNTTKWEAEEYTDEYFYLLETKVKEKILSKMVITKKFEKKKKWLLSKETTWEENIIDNILFKLLPIVLHKEYNEIEIKIIHIYKGANYEIDPSNLLFSRIEDDFIKILMRLQQELAR